MRSISGLLSVLLLLCLIVPATAQQQPPTGNVLFQQPFVEGMLYKICYFINGVPVLCPSGLVDDSTSIITTELMVAAGFISTGPTNGYLTLGSIGVAPAPPSNGVQLTVGTVTTPYTIVFPPAPPTAGLTVMSCTATNPSICSWVAP